MRNFFQQALAFPLPGVACAWAMGLWSPWRLPGIAVLFALGFAILLAYAAPSLRAKSWRALLFFAAFLAGLGVSLSNIIPPLSMAGTSRIEGVVEDGARGHVVLLEGLRLEGGSLPANTSLALVGADLQSGDHIVALVKLFPPSRFRNGLSRGHHERVRGRVLGDIRILDRSWHSALRAKIRLQIRDSLDRSLSSEAAALGRAIILGERGGARESREAFRNAGLAHLLAVSGLHVGLLGLFVLLCLRTLLLTDIGRPVRDRISVRQAAALLTIPVLLFYAWLTGGSPSASRAACMGALALLSRGLARRPSSLSSLAGAVLLYSAFFPEEARGPGFLLSCSATLGILTIPDWRPFSWWSRLKARLRWPLSRDDTTIEEGRSALELSWLVTLRATVATMPVVWWFFGSVPLVGLLANLVLVPIATSALVPLYFLHPAFEFIGLGVLSSAPIELIASGLGESAHLFSESSWGLDLPPLHPAQALLLGGGALLFLFPPSRYRKRLWALLLAAGSLSEVAVQREGRPHSFRATFIDVGQGDSTLVDLPGGGLVLIDAGGGEAHPGERALLPLLRMRRRSKIDLVIVTHPHPDHFGGLRALLGEIEIGQVWDSGQAEDESPHGPAARLLREMRRRGTRVRTPQELCGIPHSLSGVQLRLEWPCPEYDPGLGPNDNSMVVRIAHGARSILFTGDVERLAEAELSTRTNLQAELLQVPHHGSRTSSTPAFLETVRPSFAFISAGRGNRYGHPHQEVLQNYERAGVAIRRLDQQGGFVASATRAGWEIRLLEESSGR